MPGSLGDRFNWTITWASQEVRLERTSPVQKAEPRDRFTWWEGHLDNHLSLTRDSPGESFTWTITRASLLIHLMSGSPGQSLEPHEWFTWTIEWGHGVFNDESKFCHHASHRLLHVRRRRSTFYSSRDTDPTTDIILSGAITYKSRLFVFLIVFGLYGSVVEYVFLSFLLQ